MAKSKKDTYKFIVIEPYYDGQIKKEMLIGEEIDLETERAQELINLKLIKSLVRK